MQKSTYLVAVSQHPSGGRIATYLVVGFSSASSMAQVAVARCSQPYASTPSVCPANFFRLHGFWIDFSSGNSPAPRSAQDRCEEQPWTDRRCPCCVMGRSSASGGQQWSVQSRYRSMPESRGETARRVFSDVGGRGAWSMLSRHTPDDRNALSRRATGPCHTLAPI